MRELFPQYYPPSSDDLEDMWHNAIFVFDTNTLLNCYRYTPSTWDDFLKVLEALRGRVWIPHQVGLEFSRNRLTVIAEQNNINNLVHEYNAFVEKKFNQDIKQKYHKRGHFFADLEKIERILHQTRIALREELDQARQRYPEPREADPVLDRLDRLFQGKIGPAYSDEQLVQLSSEFQKRYQKRTPPGYKDAKKAQTQSDKEHDPNPGNSYGDVILWYQIIDYAKEQQRPIIFVLDDVKEDWWQEIAGKKIGPRPELKAEINQKAGVAFHTYTTDAFVRRAQEYIRVQIKQETLDELREQQRQKNDAMDVEEIYAFFQRIGALIRGAPQTQEDETFLDTVRFLLKYYINKNSSLEERSQFYTPKIQIQDMIRLLDNPQLQLEYPDDSDEDDDAAANDNAKE